MTVLTALLPSLGATLGKVLDRVIPDEEEREKIKLETMTELLSADQRQLEAAMQVVVAEASGESWLQRNWRPMVMLWLSGLVGAYWLGFTPENLPPEAIGGLLDIVQVGLGGYVIGRSAEKVTRIWRHGDVPSTHGPGGVFER